MFFDQGDKLFISQLLIFLHDTPEESLGFIIYLKPPIINMDFKGFINRRKSMWHKHFLPSLLAAIVVAIISFLYEVTISNIILFASVGASAIILTNSKSHHLTKLHTVVISYVICIVVSMMVYVINIFILLHMSVNIFLLVFLVGILLFLFNVFHPPAITASLSFILLQRPAVDLVYLFVAIIILLIIVRIATYKLSQHLSLRKFLNEFRRSF
jgi:hypothetical protein